MNLRLYTPQDLDLLNSLTADALRGFAEAVGYMTLAATYGGCYSGKTYVRVKFADSARAWTTPSKGERYTRRGMDRKTDAVHHITMRPEAVHTVMYGTPSHVRRIGGFALLEVLERDGAVLRGIFAHAKGKQITSSELWMAWDGALVYHAKTRRGAELGLRKLVSPESGESVLLKNGYVSKAKLRKRTGWCAVGVDVWLRANLPAYRKASSAPAHLVRVAAGGAPYDGYAKELLALTEDLPEAEHQALAAHFAAECEIGDLEGFEFHKRRECVATHTERVEAENTLDLIIRQRLPWALKGLTSRAREILIERRVAALREWVANNPEEN